jgi:Protein of unknown function (DUF998)
VRRTLLVCGILASLIYTGADILGALTWPGYSMTSFSISELMAIDAPSRSHVVPLFLAHGVLVVAFGIGVWQSAIGTRSLKAAAGTLIALGIVDWAGPFAPVHQRGHAMGATETAHIVITGVISLLIVTSMAFAAASLGKRFRGYTIATIAILLGFGVWAALDGPRIAAGLPTPWLGVKERINVYAYLLWQIVFAIALLRFKENREIELHDTRITRVDHADEALVIRLDAYVHHSRGVPGVDVGTGWSHGASVRLRGGTLASPPPIPAVISDGTVYLGARRLSNMLPVDLEFIGKVRIELLLTTGDVVLIEANEIEVELLDPGTYVEEFRPAR